MSFSPLHDICPTAETRINTKGLIHVLKIQEIKTKTKQDTSLCRAAKTPSPSSLHSNITKTKQRCYHWRKWRTSTLHLLVRKRKRQNLKVNIRKGNIYPHWRRYTAAARPVFVFIDNVCGTLNSQESIRFNSHYRNDCFFYILLLFQPLSH